MLSTIIFAISVFCVEEIMSAASALAVIYRTMRS